MDFGIEGFLEKFEKHFGPRATKALLLLVGLAVASVCLATIAKFLVVPVLAFFEAPQRSRVLVLFLYYCLGTGVGVSAGWALMSLLGRHRTFPSRAAVEALAERDETTRELMAALARLVPVEHGESETTSKSAPADRPTEAPL